MFFQIELLLLILMLAVFVVCLIWGKLPSGICLMIAAFVGMGLGTLFNGTDFSLRFLFEGAFGYLDTILTICFSMMCIGAMRATGILDYFTTKIVKIFRKTPSLLLIILAFVVMFPAMVTGSAICSAITTGAIVLPILIKWGVPKQKASAFIVAESIIGEILPPINIPAMVICDSVDIPFSGFGMPLIAMCVPVAIFMALVLARKYVKPIDEKQLGKVVNLEITKELNFASLIPLLTIIVFLLAEIVFPKYLAIFGITLVFALSTILAFIFGKKIKFYNGFDDKETVVGSLIDSVKNSFSVIGILMGIGMFMSVFALVGIRGYLAVNVMLIPRVVQIILSAIALPALGGISAYGSASIIGPAFVMSFYQRFDPIILVCGFSLLAAIGDFMPPTAISTVYLAQQTDEKNYLNITKAGFPAIGGMAVTGLFYAFVVGKIVIGKSFLGDVITPLGNFFYVIVMIVLTLVALSAYSIYSLILKKHQAKEGK